MKEIPAVIDVIPLLKIAPIFAVALASPGPDFMLISSVALSRGRVAGLQASVGIAFGALVWVVLCMFGLGFVFAKVHGLMTAVRLCGGLYLVYLGYQLWKASLKPRMDKEEMSAAEIRKQRNPFVVGFLTNITNPKAMAFFTSIFAITLPQEASLATQGAIVVMMGILPVLWFGFVSFCLSAPTMRKVYVRGSRWIDRVAGTFLAFFGARLLLSFRN